MKALIKPVSLICVILMYFQISCANRFRHQTMLPAIPEEVYPSSEVVVLTHNAWTRTHYPKRIKVFKEQPLQLHDIVFLGNSITEQGGEWGKRFGLSSLKNRGIAGDVTDGVLARLGEVIFIKPEKVFIEIGINDLFNPNLTPERTSNNILKIASNIKRHSPQTMVYVQTIFPTKNDFLIANISKVNRILRENKKNRFFTLIETHELFADSEDRMKPEYSQDGVHLNEKGYDVWVNHLRKFLK